MTVELKNQNKELKDTTIEDPYTVFNDIHTSDYKYMDITLQELTDRQCYDVGVDFLSGFFPKIETAPSKVDGLDYDNSQSTISYTSINSSQNIVIGMYKQWFNNNFGLDIVLNRGMFKLCIDDDNFTLFLYTIYSKIIQFVPILQVGKNGDIGVHGNHVPIPEHESFNLFIKMPYNYNDYNFSLYSFDRMRCVEQDQILCQTADDTHSIRMR